MFFSRKKIMDAGAMPSDEEIKSLRINKFHMLGKHVLISELPGLTSRIPDPYNQLPLDEIFISGSASTIVGVDLVDLSVYVACHVGMFNELGVPNFKSPPGSSLDGSYVEWATSIKDVISDMRNDYKYKFNPFSILWWKYCPQDYLTFHLTEESYKRDPDNRFGHIMYDNYFRY